jgi:hypothetical protein
LPASRPAAAGRRAGNAWIAAAHDRNAREFREPASRHQRSREADMSFILDALKKSKPNASVRQVRRCSKCA